ncbi:MAG: hypothetical protein F2861_05590, partial [Actinobacteria bacterium]|nr:hypothetical protein [Actinomycetota bacterium]
MTNSGNESEDLSSTANTSEKTRRAVRRDLERVRRLVDAAISALDDSDVSPAPLTPASPKTEPTFVAKTNKVAETKPEEYQSALPSASAAAIFAQLRAEVMEKPIKKVPETKAEPPKLDSAVKASRPVVTPPAPPAQKLTPPPKPVPPAPPAQKLTPPTKPVPPAPPAQKLTPPPKPVPPTQSLPAGSAASIRSRRDAVIAEVTPDLLKRARRMLRDQENLLLDAVRRSRGRYESSRLLPDRAHEGVAWSNLLTPMVNTVYLEGRMAVGKKNRITEMPERLLVEFSESFSAPLRERLVGTIRSTVSEGPYESNAELTRVMGAALGARFREWRGSDLEDHTAYVLAAVYTRGCYDAAGPGVCLKWVADETGRCPDADDNALEPTIKGHAFPTGQKYPPAHPGCRCFVIPDGESKSVPEGK